MTAVNFPPADGDLVAEWDIRDYYTMGGKNGDVPQFSAPKLGEALLRYAPAAVDAGGYLYAYHGDAWRKDGKEFYQRVVRERMGDRWQPRQASDVITWIEHGAPTLDEAPPLDRIRVRNGILRIEGGRLILEPPGVDPLTPVHLPAAYEPGADNKPFRTFMKQVLSPALERIAQEFMGYLLTPDNSHQKALLARGEGGNGKSVFVNVCGALIGKDNYTAHPLHSIGDNKYVSASLYGKLANLCADISSDELSTSALFRSITGGDPIPAEHKYRQPFTFEPYCRLIFSANRYPPIANPTNALFDRWIVLPFSGRFRGVAGEVKDLHKKLTKTPEDLSGILNYALEGLLRLRAQGKFSTAEESTEALKVFRQSADVVALFLSEVTPGWVKRADLFVQFQGWCNASNHHRGDKMSSHAFYERARAVLGKEVRRRGVDGWKVE